MWLCTAALQVSSGLSTPVCLSHQCHTVSFQTLRLKGLGLESSPFLLLGCRRHSGAAWMALLEPALSLVPWGHTLLVCTLLLLLAALRLTLDSMKLALSLNHVSYLIVDLAGLTPSSRPQIKIMPPEQ